MQRNRHRSHLSMSPSSTALLSILRSRRVNPEKTTGCLLEQTQLLTAGCKRRTVDSQNSLTPHTPGCILLFKALLAAMRSHSRNAEDVHRMLHQSIEQVKCMHTAAEGTVPSATTDSERPLVHDHCHAGPCNFSRCLRKLLPKNCCCASSGYDLSCTSGSSRDIEPVSFELPRNSMWQRPRYSMWQRKLAESLLLDAPMLYCPVLRCNIH
ncbi:TPA: hypothetical protein ACH3X1_011248 [Trebouxia sp. C0004]